METPDPTPVDFAIIFSVCGIKVPGTSSSFLFCFNRMFVEGA